METPSTVQQMAAGIFADMVMDEAIKDKEVEIKQQLKDEEGNLIDPDNVDEYIQQQQNQRDKDDDDDLDQDEENIMRSIREQRLIDMKNEYQEKQENQIKGHGKYTEIVEEEFLPNVTSSKYTVCHFYHQDFERCKIVDKHLRVIAHNHTEAKFIYLNAEKSPFFIQKLAIKMLPTIICFVDGVAVDRIVGFDDLGNKDDFPTLALTRRLIIAGVLAAKNKQEAGIVIKKKGKGKNADSDNSDGDDY